MSVAATGLLAVAFFAATGIAVGDLVPALRRKTIPARLAYGYLLGIAWTAGLLYASSHVFHVTLRRGTILPVAMIPIVVALARAGTARPLYSPSRKSRVVLSLKQNFFFFLVLLVPAFVTLGVFSEAVTDPVRDWDGRTTWAAQARFIRQERTVDAQVLREGRWSVSHPRYPLLMPLAQVAALEVLDASDDTRLMRPLYAAFFPVFLVLLFDGASQRAGRRAAALATLAAAFVPMFATEPNGGALGCYSDLPLGCFFGAGLLLLLERRGGASEGAVAGLLLGAAVLTKIEGLPLALVGIAIGFLWSTPVWRRLGSPAAIASRLVTLAVVLAAVLLLRSWQRGIPNRSDENYVGMLVVGETWARFLPRLGQGLKTGLACLMGRNTWSFFWPLAALVAILGRRAFKARQAGAILCGTAAPLAVACAAYGVSIVPRELASVTFSRFLVQASVPLLCFFAMCLREALRSRPLRRHDGPELVRVPVEHAGEPQAT